MVFIGCQQNHKKRNKPVSIENRLESMDFTLEGSFTDGIEGPAADARGNIYAVNFERQGTIGKIFPDGRGEVFASLPDSSIGNGIRFNSLGDMFVADYTGHNILKIDMKTKKITIFAHEDKMNQPNDLAIGNNDILYASDPNWADSTGNLWRVDADGRVVLLESGMGTTNGIEVSPDGKQLYVNESVQRKIWVYDLSQSGEISNKRLFFQFEDYSLDGMRCDTIGNLYITRHGKGTVVIISPAGKILEEIQLKGKKPSNICFSGEDGRTCYVTLADRGCIEMFRAKYPGRSFRMNHN